MIGLDKNSVKVVPYDATWKDEFEKEKVILKNLFILSQQHLIIILH